jgi:hypothetical protein
MVAGGNWNDNDNQVNLNENHTDNQNDNARFRASVMISLFSKKIIVFCLKSGHKRQILSKMT